MSTATPFAGLHQWEPDDSVLRESFNEDFRKIDDALKTLASSATTVKLAEIVTTQTAPQIDVDMSTIPWADFQEIVLYLTLFTNEPADQTMISPFLRVNNIGGSDKYFFTYDNGVIPRDQATIGFLGCMVGSYYLGFNGMNKITFASQVPYICVETVSYLGGKKLQYGWVPGEALRYFKTLNILHPYGSGGAAGFLPGCKIKILGVRA